MSWFRCPPYRLCARVRARFGGGRHRARWTLGTLAMAALLGTRPLVTREPSDLGCAGAPSRSATDADRAFHADFGIEYDEDEPLTIAVRVLPGGFPRDRAEHVRFAFGDGHSSWGEVGEHRYREPGVYVVELEIVSSDHPPLRTTRLAVVGPPPAPHNPLELTVNRIPAYLSGRLPYPSDRGTPGDPNDDRLLPFFLVVPTYGFTIDVDLLEVAAAPVDRASLVLTADRDLAGGALPAGTNLADRLVFETAPGLHAPRARWQVGAADALPPGDVTLTVRAQTSDGAAHARTLRIEAAPLPPERHPFDRPLQWLLRFDLDHFTTSGRTLPDGRVAIHSRPGGDGEPDFAAELALLGAQSGDTASGARDVLGRGSVGASSVYLAWIEHEIVREVYRYFHMGPDGEPYDGIAFPIFVHGDPGAPDPERFHPDGELSLLRVGGALGGYLGRSYFGVYNERRVDDTGPEVGVASGTILDALASNAELTGVFDPIKPGVGSPVGEDPLDVVVLSDAFDRRDARNDDALNARYDALAAVVRFVALAMANIVAHEMGHAMGLMPNGAPPDGFFGGRRDVKFLGEHTDSHHADFPGVNLMQAGGNLVRTLTTTLDHVSIPSGYDLVALARGFAYENRLSPYELAYLQGRLTYRNFKGSTSAGALGCR